jgi:hypothetical protein
MDRECRRGTPEGGTFRASGRATRGEHAVNTLYVDDTGRLWAGTATA